VNCAVLYVKDDWKGQFSEACAIAYQNCAVYSVFPSGVTSHSKIARFKFERTAPLTNDPHGSSLSAYLACSSMDDPDCDPSESMYIFFLEVGHIQVLAGDNLMKNLTFM
jgi:hypothetical protein